MFKKFCSIWLVIICLFASNIAFAQVSGISYTLAPNADYNLWDNQSGLDDGLTVGGKLGFGFGELFELRASYNRSIGLKTNFADIDSLPNFADSLFVSRDVSLSRWGGELKMNLSKQKFVPYFLLGTGVQTIQLKDSIADMHPKHKQIYISGGAGLKFSIADRTTLGIEARATAYRFNAVNNLLTDEDQTTFGVIPGDYEAQSLLNWSVGASLQFYLAGRRPDEMSALDKAYFRNLSNSFKNIGGSIQPMVGRMNFDDALGYRDTWMAGVSAGIDLGPYIGIRGFYWQSLQDGEATKFDHLAMYGGELNMRLNVNTGLVPYITLGGGNIHLDEDYLGKTILTEDSTLVAIPTDLNKAFMSAGAGLIIPISKNFQLFGGARAILTSGVEGEDLQGPDQIQTSLFYTAGLKLSFGKKSLDPDKIVSARVDDALSAQKAEIDAQTEAYKQQYEARIIELEQELNEAIVQQDYQKAASIKQEKEAANQVVAELEKRQVEREQEKIVEQQQEVQKLKQFQQQVASPSPYGQSPYPQQYIGNTGVTLVPTSSEIRMSPAEFENLIEEILEGMGGQNNQLYPYVQDQMMMQNQTANNAAQVLKEQEINRRFESLEDELEKQIVELNKRQDEMTLQQTQMSMRQEQMEKNLSEQLRTDLAAFTQQLSTALQSIDDKMDGTREELIKMNGRVNALEQNQNNNSGSAAPNNGGGTTIIFEDDKKKDDPINVINVPSVQPEPKVIMLDSLGRRIYPNKINYDGMSGFVGVNFGGSNTINVGARWHYAVGKKGIIELMPEVFLGFGTSTILGLSGNVILPIKLKKLNGIKPYIGTGVGLMKLEQGDEDKLRGGFNIIAGSYLNVWKGKLYVDITGRNLFKNTQLAAGYRFSF